MQQRRRTVEIIVVEEYENSLCHDKKMCEAIGYLASWAIGAERYHSARLVVDKEGNVDSQVTDKEGNTTYQILGLRADDGSYSFHS